MTLARPPLALYAHFPWCVQKCPYCDFNSHRAPEQIPEARYIDALLADLDRDLERHFSAADPSPLVSIFLGGGTPSLFSPAAIARLLVGVRQRLRCDAEMEVTLEANPGTIEHGRFAEYRAAGVNRVSLGAQSFNAAQLKRLGRIHGSDDVLRAVTELRSAGIDNFNLDLMYALPEQTLHEALQDLEQALALAPSHLSHYQLTLEPGTAFYHQPPPLPDDERSYDMQLACQARLQEAGYRHYEVSAYARGQESRHNRNYWEFGDYFGLGAGAHGKFTHPDGVWRTERCKSPRQYLEDPPSRLLRESVVQRHELPFEFMLNALRLVSGFSVSAFEARTGIAWSELSATIAQAQQAGLLEAVDHEHWRPTARGRELLNDLIGLFLAAD